MVKGLPDIKWWQLPTFTIPINLYFFQFDWVFPNHPIGQLFATFAYEFGYYPQFFYELGKWLL